MRKEKVYITKQERMSLRPSTQVLIRLRELLSLLKAKREAVRDLQNAPSLAAWIRAAVCRAYGYVSEGKKQIKGMR